MGQFERKIVSVGVTVTEIIDRTNITNFHKLSVVQKTEEKLCKIKSLIDIHIVCLHSLIISNTKVQTC